MPTPPFQPDTDTLKRVMEYLRDDPYGKRSAMHNEFNMKKSVARSYWMYAMGAFYQQDGGVVPPKPTNVELGLTQREAKQLEVKRELAQAIKLMADKLAPIEIPPPATYKPDKDSELAVLTICDVHTGLVVRPQENQKSNFYDPSITIASFDRIKEAMVSIIKKKQGGFKGFVGLDIDILGDVVEGDGGVYPGQLWRADMGVLEQANLFVELMLDLIIFASTKFRKVTVHYRSGNHGRSGGRYQGKRPEDNWDRVAYNTLHEVIERIKPENVESRFELSDYSDWEIVDRFGWQFFLEHGDKIKASVNTENMARRRLSRIQQDTGKRIDWGEFGHWHFLSLSPPVIFGGCFPGVTEYTLGQFDRPCPAMQAMFAVHPRWGVTWFNAINLRRK